MIAIPPAFRTPGVSAFWDAQNVSGNYVQPANNDPVSVLVNSFNNANLNGSNGTPANQPLFVANALNGQPALSFNGTTQTLGVPNTTALQISSQFCIIAVVDVSLLAAQLTIFSKGNSGTNPDYAFMLNRTAPGQVSFWNRGLNGGLGGWLDSPTNFSKTGSEPVVIGINWTGTVYSFTGNGNSLGGVSNSTAILTSNDPAVIGAFGASALNSKFAGNMSKLFLARRFMSGVDFTDTYRSFANRMGLNTI